jgi:NADH:ubiquinone oxidoreductase subunit 6 (subunit J)
MLNMSITEGLVCQLVSWPFAITACSWQQWMPALAGLFTALGFRVKGIGRLVTFVVGVFVFYLFAIAQVVTAPPTHGEQPDWFLLGCLFLFPIASIVSLSGLLGGDLFRIFRKRARENNASI